MPVVAIIGRPNVGKSTLFNRISKENISITNSKKGVTRDRIYKDVSYFDYNFTLIDTGGIEEENSLPFIDKVKKQADIAIKQADLILFVVNIKENITLDDEYICKILLKSNKKVILVVNFYDNIFFENNLYEYYRLGFKDIVPISSAHGHGISKLIKEITKNIARIKNKKEENAIYINIIGRPNVGKSSLVNSILHQERSIVSDLEGTTIDNIQTPFFYKKQKYVITDTAGIKRRKKSIIDKLSLSNIIESSNKTDINIMLLDISDTITEQDKKISSIALDSKKGIIIVANKWDKIRKDSNTMKKYKKYILDNFKYMKYVEIVFLSAIENSRIHYLFEAINKVYTNYSRRAPTRILNNILQESITITPPSIKNGRKLKIYYVTQTSIQPPTFIIFVNDKELIHFSYKRFLENQLRENIQLEGTPINLIFRSKGE